MKLMEALRLCQYLQEEAGGVYHLGLLCGCEPLHLKTFFTAYLKQQLPAKQIQVESGLYGDLLGNIQRAATQDWNSTAVLLEWADCDPRLGIRQLGGWKPEQLNDILASTRFALGRLQESILALAEKTTVALSLPTLALPPVAHTPAFQLSGFELSLQGLINDFALHLTQSGRIYILSPAALDRLAAPATRRDVKSEALYGFPYQVVFADVIAEQMTRLLTRLTPRKGIITDLDNTFWKGIIGEIGMNAVSWNLDGQGQVHGLYQQLLASLAASGTLIAVASKNDAKAVSEAFQREDLLLKEAQIFPMEVHWNAKSESVGRILKAWNIGADSVVFVDDSPMELEEVKAKHPAIECILFPTNDYAAILELLTRLRDLCGKSILSAEDTLRLQSLRQAQELNVLQESGSDLTGFLKEAGAELQVSFAKAPFDTRAHELVNKTNQFNLNGKRYTEADWKQMLEDPAAFLMTVSYADKYGSLGKIAVLQGRKEGNALYIQAWAMSCRAFARHIEYRSLELLFEYLQVECLFLDYQRTERNSPAQGFLDIWGSVETTPLLKISKSEFQKNSPTLYHTTRIIV
ncbi:MAG: HAD-IIIC family phosphatase [Armatimonadetes bacterium]|nr:HAD-IIIC family phosphatase [Armatimonadota bacterium]